MTSSTTGSPFTRGFTLRKRRGASHNQRMTRHRTLGILGFTRD